MSSETETPGDGLSRRAAPLLVLIVVLVAHVALATAWMHRTGFLARPPAFDEARNRHRAWVMQRVLDDEGVGGLLRHVRETPSSHPPLHVMTAAGVAQALGREVDRRVMWITSAGFGVLLLLGVWRLARRFASPWASVAAVAITAVCPVFVGHERGFLSQLPMAAALTWAFAFFVSSRGLTRVMPSLGAAFALGVAGLLKMLAPLYVVGAVVATLIVGSRRGAARWSVLASGTVLFLALVVPWYWWHGDAVRAYVDKVVGADGQQVYSAGLPLASLRRWTYYPIELVNNGLGFGLSCLVVMALPCLLVRRPAVRTGVAVPLVATVIMGTVILVFGQTQGHSQYLLPFVPLLVCALVTAADRLRSRVVWGVVLAVAAFQGWLDFRSPEEDRALVTWRRLEIVGRADVWIAPLAVEWALTTEPGAEAWPIPEFVERILAESAAAVPFVVWVVEQRHPWFHIDTFRLEAQRRGRDLKTLVVDELSDLGPDMQPPDFFVVEDRVIGADRFVRLLRPLPVKPAILMRAAPTPRCRYALIKLE